MNIAVAVKVVPDDQDIRINADRTLNFANAKPTVSTYDLNAIEAAALLAQEQDGVLRAVTVGDASCLEGKVAKNILARGVSEYVACVDEQLADADAHATACALAALVGTLEACDLVVCGDGSADVYAQQTDVQLACALGWPVVTAVSKMRMEDGVLVCERSLEGERETVAAALPVVVSVVPDIALPRICGMKDILAAGKKPVVKHTAPDLGVEVVRTIEVDNVLAPEPLPRKKEMFDAADEGGIDGFVAALSEAIR